MANIIKELVRRSLFPKSSNLASFRDPFQVMQQLLAGHDVTHILDAGASHGRISRKLLRLFPDASVHAFEPQPRYRDKLAQLHESDARFIPYFLALSDTAGTIDLQITQSPGVTSLFRPNQYLRTSCPEDSAIVSVETVEMTTIDGWAKSRGGIPLQLMKFDIQGGELQALRGARETLDNSTLLVYTEILFNPLYEGGAIYSEIDLLLRDSGFILYDIYKPRYSGNGLLLWGNAIFIKQEILQP